MRFLSRICVVGLLCHSSAMADDRQIDFNRDVRPILSDKCMACHGPDAERREADLRLDVESDAKADRDGSPSIVPGDPEQSLLIERIISDDVDERMPPADSGKTLTNVEIEILRLWVKQGAPWAPHWAYVAPVKHPAPKPNADAWALNWIDNFILAGLEQADEATSPDADQTTLIRRLSFDLTGLPPDPDAVLAFTRSHDEAAYERLVDELLASDHFGERLATYWLDLVRFADTVGYHGDQDHNITPYRDWVIDAFCDNMPFDQFTREQLAGDLLSDASVDQRVATGYNRMLQTTHEGGLQQKEYLAIYAADRVRNFSVVWMGATMGCCQCHDHKFDPYTMKDFYSIAAFFADIDESKHFRTGTNALPTKRPPELEVLSKRERRLVAKLSDEIATLELEKQEAETDEIESLTARIAGLKLRRDKIAKSKRKSMITVAIAPRTMRVLPRGNWLDDSGPIVTPAVPEFLGRLDTGQRPANRLDLARWLCDTDEGIGLSTARVMVNRFWYLLFGAGLAEDLSDFGGQGATPVYPELLDNLAVEFVESGWDVKHIIKRIVMSRTYRQSSGASVSARERDPGNRLFARQARHRLAAEFVRDAALSVSGLLVRDIGGRSVKPYQPAGYYRHLNFPVRKYQQDADDHQWRRGLYVHWQRQFLHPMLKAFDGPSREECTARRPQSNTPLAALALLNDPTFVEAARVFGEKILTEGGSTFDERLDFAFRCTVSREPDAREREIASMLFTESQTSYKADREGAAQLAGVGLATEAADTDPVTLAAWTTVARALLNMSETVTRN